jgi:polar amino acid transport system substrate-binding protein
VTGHSSLINNIKLIFKIIFFAVIALVYSHSVFGGENEITLNSAAETPLSNSRQSGFLDEVAKEAFSRIGYRLNIEHLPPERGLKNSNKGLIDGELIRIKGLGKLYPNLIFVPENIISLEFVVFSKSPLNLSNGWSDLSGKTVAHVNGWKYLEENIPTTADITKVGNATILFNLLEKNRTDSVVYELWGGNWVVLKHSMKGIIVNSPPLAIKEMFIYLHKKHEEIIPKLSKALRDMKNDGRYEFLVKKHLTPLELQP